jgi:two-component system, sensor histidine kinase and response regulator
VKETLPLPNHQKITIETLQGVFELLPYPFLLSRKHSGTWVHSAANRHFTTELGYTLDDIPTIDEWFSKAYPDQSYRNDIRKEWEVLVKVAAEQKETKIVQRVVVQTRHKGPQWFEVTNTWLGDVIIVAFINIHEVKSQELKMAEENQNRDKILSILGHDLRSPIAKLVSLTNLFHQSSLSTEEINRVMSAVHQDVVLTYDLLETMLTWTKSNFSRLESKKSEVDLRSLMNGVLDLFETDLKAKDLRVEMLVASSPGLSDPGILTIVLRNLLSNAIKFSRPKGKISIRTDRSDKEMKVTVGDSGMGMSKEAIHFITTDQPFTKAGTFREQGFGLGLRLCREFLPLIDGKLEIQSAEGTGTSMIVRFPF